MNALRSNCGLSYILLNCIACCILHKSSIEFFFFLLVVSSGTLTVGVKSEVEVLKGETAKLPCVVTSTTNNPVVEWHIEEQGTRKRVAYRQGKMGKDDDGTPLTGRVQVGEDFTLTISSVKPSDEQTFICQVTAGADGSKDNSTLLKVFCKSANDMISNSHSVCVCVCFKNFLPFFHPSCLSETYMVPSLVKEASGLFTVRSTLYMQPTKADKDSEFYCTVEYSMPGNNIQTMNSDRIKINLNYPSEKATFYLNSTGPVKEGDTVTMICETDGNPQPPFDFTKNGAPIVGPNGVVTLKSVKRSDAGEYKCSAMDFDNLDADLTGTINLTVNYIDPVKVTPPDSQTVKLGEKVTWQCKTKASRDHTVQWKKGSEVLSQNGTLSIQAVSYDNGGEYVCVGAVPSVPGLTAQASVSLIVKGKPRIDPPAPGEVGKEGDKVTLKCSAYGLPRPQFTWKPSGEESVSVEGDKMVSTLTLKATAEILKDGVTCEASNEHGADSATFPVSLKQAVDNSAEGRAFSLLLLFLSSLLLSGLFVVQTL
uniref:Basal cell adhesion molecule (Lutheran blood group) n=1 Tax=Amphilophus citrinellus TaxID=61819 RepID=A0A3Q0SA63_AMPCI